MSTLRVERFGTIRPIPGHDVSPCEATNRHSSFGEPTSCNDQDSVVDRATITDVHLTLDEPKEWPL